MHVSMQLLFIAMHDQEARPASWHLAVQEMNLDYVDYLLGCRWDAVRLGTG